MKRFLGKMKHLQLGGGGRSSTTKKHCWDIIVIAQRGRGEGKTEQKLEPNYSGNTNTLTGVQKDNMILQINDSKESGGVQPFQQNRVYDTDGILPALPAQMSSGTHAIQVKSATKEGFEIAHEGDSINYTHPNSKTRRGRVGVGVAQTLDTQVNQSVLLQGNIRRLTEIECERLQGFKDNWTKFGMFPEIKMSQEKFNKLPTDEKIAYINSDSIKKEISKGQRYKLCGNAVTRNIVELVGKKLLTHPQGNIF